MLDITHTWGLVLKTWIGPTHRLWGLIGLGCGLESRGFQAPR